MTRRPGNHLLKHFWFSS